jgi:two-component system sensor histidine kinase ChiS
VLRWPRFFSKEKKVKDLQDLYLQLSLWMIGASLFAAFLFALMLYVLWQTGEPSQVKQDVLAMENTLSVSLDGIEEAMVYVGQDIAQLPELTDDAIAEILARKSQNIVTDLRFSWSLLDWTDPQKRMRVNSVLGVVVPPIDMRSRTHLENTSRMPWTLMFSNPAIGIPSNEWVLPAGIGVQSSNGTYLGSLDVGISIQTLLERLQSVIRSPKRIYALLNSDSRVILASPPLTPEMVQQILPIGSFGRPGEFKHLSVPIRIDNAFLLTDSYVFQKHPLTVLVGIDEWKNWIDLLTTLAPRVFEALALATCGVILLSVFRHRILRPMMALGKAAKALAMQQPIVIPNCDIAELEMLADQLREIHRVKAELSAAYETIESAHASIRRYNLILEEKVQARTEALEKALAAKTEFLNNISHEIRTPIQGITAISQGLIDHWRHFTTAQRFIYAEKVALNAKRLLSLMSNLLDISKFTAGKMVMHWQSFDWVPLLEEICDESRELYLRKKPLTVALSVVAPPGCTQMEGDPDRMMQVLRNLLDNAIKFTDRGTVTLSLEAVLLRLDSDEDRFDGWLLEVKDNGIGIPEDELSNIFNPFTQSRYTKTKAGGTGIGLSICQEIVAAHGGWIAANSRDDGQTGAVFRMVVPAQRLHPESGEPVIIQLTAAQTEYQPAPENRILVQQQATASLPFVDSQAPVVTEEEEAQETSPSVSLPCLLVIDDEISCVVAVELMLHGVFQVKGALGLQETLEYLESADPLPDIILLDLMMPEDQGGVGILKALHSWRAAHPVPILLQTGSMDHEAIAEAFTQGVDASITKPYNRATLLAMLQSLLPYHDSRLLEP